MVAGSEFPGVVCALLGAAAVFLVGSASAAWHAQVFMVGGEPRGWAKPAVPNDETYNHWATRNRFHVGDFLHFKYDKNDSVLVVSRDDYKFCDAAKPVLRFDDGDTRFRLDRSGFCYFISGAPGHCDAGQRMTVRVLPPLQDEGSSRPAPAEAPTAPSPGEGGGEDEGGSYTPPFGSGSGSGGSGGSTPGHGASGPSSGSGSGSTSSPTRRPPPHGAAGSDGNNTSGSARASPAFIGCGYHVVVGAVVLGAVLLVLAA